MLNFFKKNTYTPFIFSLICGISYYLFLYQMIAPIRGGSFLSVMFCPAIVCASALCVIKLIKRFIDNENKNGINFIVIMHIIVIIAAVLTTIVAHMR